LGNQWGINTHGWDPSHVEEWVAPCLPLACSLVTGEPRS
jgi:hypothetical protein